MIAIHILQWNKASLTIKCLAPLLQTGSFHIRILDNGSEPEEQKKLLDYLGRQQTKTKAKLSVFSSNQNLGFSAGHSYLLEKSENDDDSIIVVLNNDVVVNAKVLVDCAKHLELDKSLACLVPMSKKDNKLTVPCFRFFPLTSRFQYVSNLGADFDSSIAKNKWVYPDGACLVISATSINSGDLDIAPFCYFEELVLVEKWRSQGKRWRVFQDGFFKHAGGESTAGDNAGHALRFYNEVWSATWYAKRVFGLMAWPIVILRNMLRSMAFICKMRFGDLPILWSTSLEALSNKVNRYKVGQFTITKIWSANHEDII